MSPKPKIYKKEYAKELLKIAKGDLESAQILASHSSGRLENIAFLAHQAVEKCLKSLLCHLEKPIPFTHDIAVLCALIPEEQLPPSARALESLTEFALGRRYEESPEILSPEDFQNAVLATQKLLSEVSAIVGT